MTRKRKIILGVLGGLAVAGLAAAAVLRDPSPVGHWNSTAGRDDFLETYRVAFQDMPAPAEQFDVRTDYGVVRAYRFAGEAGEQPETPLVLLPGTASASPVWADNLPGLLRLGDVYTIDLLGEPGMSVQDRPIETDDDKAGWLDQTLAGLPADTFHVIGLSIGGWTAANLTLRQPRHVASLTMIEPVQVFGDIPLGTVVRSIPAAFPWMPRSWRDNFTSYTAGGAPVEDVPVADMIEAGMRHYTMKQSQPARIGEDQVARFPRPTLVILAGRSVMHDTAAATEVAERALPPGHVLVYPEATHAINGEEPDRLATDIGAFLHWVG